MRDLVPDQGEDLAPRVGRACRRVEQQTVVLERDGAPMLHRTDMAVRNANQVELGKRVFHAEIVIEVAQHFDRAVEREASLLALAGGRDHAHGDAVDLRGNPFEFAGGEREEIARHLRRWLERNLLCPRPNRLLACDRHIAHGRVRARQRDGERERRLQRWLVPNREHPARIGRGKMARDQALAAVLRLVIDGIKAGTGFVDLPREGEVELVTSDREWPLERQRDRLGIVVVSDGGATWFLVDRGARDLDAVGVEHDPRGRLAHLDVDDLEAVDLAALRVECEVDVVVEGDDGLRQPAGVPGAAWRGDADRT